MKRGYFSWIVLSLIYTALNILSFVLFNVPLLVSAIDEISSITGYQMCHTTSKTCQENVEALPFYFISGYIKQISDYCAVLGKQFIDKLAPSTPGDGFSDVLTQALTWLSPVIVMAAAFAVCACEMAACWCSHASVLHKRSMVRLFAFFAYYPAYYISRYTFLYLGSTYVMSMYQSLLARTPDLFTAPTDHPTAVAQFTLLVLATVLFVFAVLTAIANFSYARIMYGSIYCFKYCFYDSVAFALPERTPLPLKCLLWPLFVPLCLVSATCLSALQMVTLALGCLNASRAGRYIFIVIICLLFGGAVGTAVTGALVASGQFYFYLAIGLGVAAVGGVISAVAQGRSPSARLFDLHACLDTLPDSQVSLGIVRSEAMARANVFAAVPKIGPAIAVIVQYIAQNPVIFRGQWRPGAYCLGLAAAAATIAAALAASHAPWWILGVFGVVEFGLQLISTRETGGDDLRTMPRPYMGWTEKERLESTEKFMTKAVNAATDAFYIDDTERHHEIERRRSMALQMGTSYAGGYGGGRRRTSAATGHAGATTGHAEMHAELAPSLPNSCQPAINDFIFTSEAPSIVAPPPPPLQLPAHHYREAIRSLSGAEYAMLTAGGAADYGLEVVAAPQQVMSPRAYRTIQAANIPDLFEVWALACPGDPRTRSIRPETL